MKNYLSSKELLEQTKALIDSSYKAFKKLQMTMEIYNIRKTN